MKKLYSAIFLLLLCAGNAGAQARLVIGNASAAYVVLANGTSSNPIYLVVANPATNAIVRNNGGIICSETGRDYNRVQWNIGTGTGNYVFPFCTPSGSYVPFYFNITSAGSPATGVLRVGSWYTNNANGPSAIPPADLLCNTIPETDVADRYWQIDPTGYATVPTATLDFYYNTGEIDAIAEADLIMQRWNSALASTCKWENEPWFTGYGTVYAASDYVEVAGVSSFSPWVMSKRTNPLPIELLTFTGECQNRKVVLHWETATEINNSHFSVQRSADGETFYEIGTKQGAGNSSNLIQYDFTDENPLNSLAYYRFKQVDFDGNYSYSNIVAVPNCSGSQSNTTIFIEQNGSIILNTISGEKKKYNVYFYDALGRTVHQEILNVDEGNNVYVLNPKKLATGIYLITLQNEEETLTQKMFMH